MNVEALRSAIAAQLPRSPALFPAGELTDRDLAFRISEMIREKLTLELNQEVPYGIAVEVERMAEEDGQLDVDAAIWVDREGQKPIVIGAGGERLKRVGRAARLALNRAARPAPAPTLWVKVRENWADNARALQRTGTGMMPQARAASSCARLHPAPPAVARYQPHPRGVHP